MRLLELQSTAALRSVALRWDDLWRRSHTAWPTLRAEPLAHWFETFIPRDAVRIFIVEADGRFLAALPFVESKVARFIRIGRLAGSDLCSVGDLLLDESLYELDAGTALDWLVQGVSRQPWPIVAFDAMFPETRRWQWFHAACDRAALRTTQRRRGMTGLIDIAGDWDAYFATRSRNHRRSTRVVTSRAEKEGTVSLKLYNDPPPQAFEKLLRRGFEVEDRSWKGPAGTSVLRTPGAFDYFREQAELIARDRGLLLAFLELDSQPIAFEYGWLCKGVYNSLKVGYDAAYERLSPGQLLRGKMLEHFHTTEEATLVDYLGPLCEATAKWTTREYAVDRLLLATGFIGNALLTAYDWLRPAVGSNSEPVQPQRDHDQAAAVSSPLEASSSISR